jgi:hypothetical protein
LESFAFKKICLKAEYCKSIGDKFRSHFQARILRRPPLELIRGQVLDICKQPSLGGIVGMRVRKNPGDLEKL